MQAQEIMTPDPMCAEPNTPLHQVAQMMVDYDCGGIPVCATGSRKLVGFLTDRDIVCRILAKGMNPLEKTAQDAMTSEIHTVFPETQVDDLIQRMEQYKVRRMPVIDSQGNIVGIIAQADLVRRAVSQQPELLEEVEEALEVISEPTRAFM